MSVLAAWAGAQSKPPDPLALVIEPLLRADSPELRGEAALALATTGDARYQSAIQDLIRDRAPAARHRAILALGVLGQPGADVILDRILEQQSHDRTEPLLANLALGLLPDEPRVPALDAFFRKAGAASRKRIRDPLVCVLLGLRTVDHPKRVTVLRSYLADATYRNRSELALVIGALARLPDPDGRQEIRKHLFARNPQTLEATLHALREPTIKLTPVEVRQVVKVADRAAQPAVRVAALELLSFHRHPEALGVAGRALDAKAPACRGAAVRTILKLGGGLLRDSLEKRILATGDPDQQVGMLHAKSGPHGDAFVQACLDLAGDPARPVTLRIAAAKVVAEAGWKQIIPLAERLFLAAGDLQGVRHVARALRRLDLPVDARLLPTRTVADVAQLPVRLRALLETGNAGARKHLFRMLTRPASPGQQLDALRAYRQAQLRLWDERSRPFVPAAVRELLGD